MGPETENELGRERVLSALQNPLSKRMGLVFCYFVLFFFKPGNIKHSKSDVDVF